jgi:hypothetical protein
MNVHAFLSIIRYYKNYPKGYSHMVVFLFELTTKDAMFLWNPDHQNVFNMLKDALVKAPIILKPNFPSLNYFVCRLVNLRCGSQFVTKEGRSE